MIEIINKPLFLHLVGYLYYWQMGFNSVFKGLNCKALIGNSCLPEICVPLYVQMSLCRQLTITTVKTVGAC